MKTFRQFLERLESLEWQAAGHLDPRILTVLTDLGHHPGIVFEMVNSWTVRSLERRQLSCHETATHYKWFIYFDKKRRFKVWLHQYKPERERRIGYAEVPHNHRYSLASVVLSGGFMHHYYNAGPELSECVEERCTYRPGDAYLVTWQRVHKLSELADQTLTVVIEGPPVRNFSEAFYSSRGDPRMFYDFVGLRPRLAKELGSLCDGRSRSADERSAFTRTGSAGRR